MSYVIENFLEIKAQIPRTVKLTVVCKKHSMGKILPIIEAGHRDFAENYIQEAKEKWQGIQGISLKLIGNLQSNKIKDALQIFDEIHTVDGLIKAEKIAKMMSENTKTKVFYLQVNIGKEDQKNGINPEDVLHCVQHSPIIISGLMCIPPAGENSVEFFNKMKEFQKHCQELTGRRFYLSMGMSGDFKEAIACGSDEIRLGSAILGER